MSEPESSEAVRRLLELFGEQSGSPIPTSALGRLRRTAAAALRTGAGALLERAFGRSGPSAETIQRLVLSLGELKGVAMKVGQIMSYMDAGLPEELRAQLALLQARSQPTDFSAIEGVLREDFGDRADVLLAGLERLPIATASIGQVHRGMLEDGSSVAVKVRHPGIAEAISADFRGANVGKALARALAPGADIAELVDEAKARFLEECDYELERRNQDRFHELYRDSRDVIIPATHPEWCSPRVLTTAWHEGAGLEAFTRGAPQDARDRAGRALYEFYLGSLYRHGLFNADPHPGNLLFSPGGTVTVLDHGCVRAFDKPTVTALARLSVAVRADDGTTIRAALRDLGVRRPEATGFEVTRRLLRAFYAPILEPGRHPMRAEMTIELRQMTADKRAMLRLQLPGKLLFLFRIRFGLYAVLARVRAVLDWQAIEDECQTGAALASNVVEIRSGRGSVG